MLNSEKILFFDGGMGTMLQARGLKLRELPEILNLTNPDLILSIHNEYKNAGSNFISANTFGANKFKLSKSNYSVKEVVEAGAKLARKAAGADGYAVLDIGSTGRVMKPSGDASFEEIYDAVAEMVNAGKNFCDVILLETFTDLYELKAAVIAAKENSDLPVFATMSFEESGRSFFGTSIEAMTATLENLVDVLGVNCSLGPRQLLPIVEKICALSHIPVMVQPNAGLPVIRDGVSKYDVTPDEFAEIAIKFADMGVKILGGCCGTTPEHIYKMKNAVINHNSGLAVKRNIQDKTVVSSSSKVATFGKKFIVIGERLNPTGKKLLQKAIREGNTDYLLKEAVKQQEQNADILDLNTGLPDINEPEVLKNSLIEIQGIVDLPIQIDSSDPEALESAARVYNGKPLLNSVSGKNSSLEKILPIAKKYGACVLGLTLDDNGIPETAGERFLIAKKIVDEAEKIGIPRRNILIDCLTLTASAQQKLVPETLKAVKLVKENLGVCTVLGLSNVSFGLPRRPLINRTMLIAAIMNGLDAAIINPGDVDLKESLYAWNLLSGDENDINNYISYCEKNPGATASAAAPNPQQQAPQDGNLISAVKKGLKDEAANETKILLKDKNPLEIIEKFIVPALDGVGKDYETGKLFLPQLIKSAEAAKSAFEVLSLEMEKSGTPGNSKGSIILATVYGDVHDIGKNIVKTILENYNFDVIDLGKDVPPEKIVDAVLKGRAHVVGLSALMTTTVASMKDTIEKLKAACPDVKIIAGGAVLTPELAKYAGADFYAKDAMEGVRILEGIRN